MFSSTLHRSASLAVTQKLGPASANRTQCVRPAILGLTSRSQDNHRRQYHSDNTVYGFKEKASQPVEESVRSIRSPKLQHLVDAYRLHGHLEAATNPLRSGGTTSNSLVRQLLQARASEAGLEEIQSQDVIEGKTFSSLQV